MILVADGLQLTEIANNVIGLSYSEESSGAGFMRQSGRRTVTRLEMILGKWTSRGIKVRPQANYPQGCQRAVKSSLSMLKRYLVEVRPNSWCAPVTSTIVAYSCVSDRNAIDVVLVAGSLSAWSALYQTLRRGVRNKRS